MNELPHGSAFGCTVGKSVEAIATQCFQALRVFVAPSQVSQLLAVEVERPGLDLTFQSGGYFEFNELERMALEAARLSGQCRGVYFTLNPLNPDVLARSINRVQKFKKGQAASDRDVVARRWLPIDIDPCRTSGVSATEEEKAMAFEIMGRVRSFLNEHGFPQPVVADSGNGYHLLYRIDLPTESDSPSRILKVLSDRFTSDKAILDTSVAAASQLIRLYGTLARKGDATSTRPHRYSALLEVPTLIIPVDRSILESFLTRCSIRLEPANACTQPGLSQSQIVQRARRYLAELPASVSGQYGHNQLFEAACRLVQGFGLSTEDAFPLLREYNERALPPWSEAELQYKLGQADAQEDDRGRGYLLSSRQHISDGFTPEKNHRSETILQGDVFPCSIADFVPAPCDLGLNYLDQHQIEPPPGRPSLNWDFLVLWQVYFGFLRQNCSPVIIPDVMLGNSAFGASLPKRWKDRVVFQGVRRRTSEVARREFERCTLELQQIAGPFATAFESDEHSEIVEQFTCRVEQLNRRKETLARQIAKSSCPSVCPLHGSRRKHSHFRFQPNTDFLGPLSQLATSPCTDYFEFDFEKKDDQGKKVLQTLIKEKQLFWAYLPIQIFGQACGLSVRQIRLVQGLMREKTRARGRRDFESIRQGSVPAMRGHGRTICPLLNPKTTYVSFGGNLREHHGRGYQIVGTLKDDLNIHGGWLRRFGYPVTNQMSDDQIVSWTSIMFLDLAELSGKLGLVVACLGKDGSWRTIDEIHVMIRSGRRRAWLSQSSLRVFAPKDHLIQWRMWIAEQLGFSFIPGGEWSQPEGVFENSSNNQSMSPEAIKSEMSRHRITQKRLAAELGWSESRVSRQLSGVLQITEELIQGFVRLRDRSNS